MHEGLGDQTPAGSDGTKLKSHGSAPSVPQRPSQGGLVLSAAFELVTEGSDPDSHTVTIIELPLVRELLLSHVLASVMGALGGRGNQAKCCALCEVLMSLYPKKTRSSNGEAARTQGGMEGWGSRG